MKTNPQKKLLTSYAMSIMMNTGGYYVSMGKITITAL